MLKKLLTTSEVAELLSVSYDTVVRLKRSGELRHVKVGRSVRFHPDVVDRFMTPGEPLVESSDLFS